MCLERRFRMLPKTIYLNYVNENDVDITWCEDPVSVYDCKMHNREYTDLSQVWHKTNEKPKIGNDIIIVDMCGNFNKCFYNGSYAWNNIVFYYKATMWAYVADILPKGGIK